MAFSRSMTSNERSGRTLDHDHVNRVGADVDAAMRMGKMSLLDRSSLVAYLTDADIADIRLGAPDSPALNALSRGLCRRRGWATRMPSTRPGWRPAGCARRCRCRVRVARPQARTRVRALTRALGPVRELDVALEMLDAARTRVATCRGAPSPICGS